MKKSILILASTTLLFGSVAYSKQAQPATSTTSTYNIQYICQVTASNNAQHDCYMRNSNTHAVTGTVNGTYAFGEAGKEFVIKPAALGTIAVILQQASVPYIISMSDTPEKSNLTSMNCTKNADGTIDNVAICELVFNYAHKSDFTELKFTIIPQ